MIAEIAMVAVLAFALWNIHYADPHFWRDIWKGGRDE